MAELQLFGQFKTMGRHNDPQAVLLLRQASGHVVKVMQKRGWRVGILEEFYPKNPSLLGMNMNRGEKVFIRLRRPGDERQFLDIYSLIGTLLHELVHIVHGPHGAKFYELLEEITTECEMQGPIKQVALGSDKTTIFWGEGHALGAATKTVPRGQCADAALRLSMLTLIRAAERRLASSCPPRSLGGASSHLGRSPREMAAEAAERRARDRQWCSTQEGVEAKRADEWACAVCTLRNPNTTRQCNACLAERGARDSPVPVAVAVEPPRKRAAVEPDAAVRGKEQATMWTCARCTFLNSGLLQKCEMCCESRSGDDVIVLE